MPHIFGKLWHLAIIWAIRKAFHCILQGVRILLAKYTRISPTSDNASYPDPVVQKYLRFMECVVGTGWYKTGGSLPSMEELSEAARPTHRYSPPTIQSMQRTHCFETHFVLTPIVNPSFNHHHHSTNRGLQLHVFIIQPTCNHQHSI